MMLINIGRFLCLAYTVIELIRDTAARSEEVNKTKTSKLKMIDRVVSSSVVDRKLLRKTLGDWPMHSYY
jgi:hypothetical protein